MYKEVIYFCAELLNYWSMTFWGLKLFTKVYDIHVNENKIVENILFALMCLPISIFAAGNYFYVIYSNVLTYIIILYMYILYMILCKSNKKIPLSLISFYIFGLRLIDLWFVAVMIEVNKLSRHIYIDLINVGINRIVFIIFLSLLYYNFYRISYNNPFMNYLIDNKFFRRLICIYSYLGNLSFSTVYVFDYRDQLIKYWIFYLVCAFLLIGAFLFYFVRIKGEERERFLNMRNDMMEANYIGLRKAYDENRTLQHDYKNHLLAVSELLKENKNKEAQEYIRTYINYSKKLSKDIKSGNEIVDIIVNCKKAEAKDKNIEFTYEIDYLDNISVEDIDMCALLANLLDNAIEACEKIVNGKSEIYFKVLKRNSMIIIQLINTVHQDVVMKKNLFKSEKKNSQLHGWGMKSIERVINKYGGTMEYCIDDNYMKIFVNIPI